MTSNNDFINNLNERIDGSWSAAQAIVEHTLTVPNAFVTLVRNCWCGIADADEFLRLSGFTTVNPTCLLSAAGIVTENKQSAASKDVLQALHILGIRSAATILAINCAVRAILKMQPGSWWQEMLQDLAENLAIGYRLGARVPELGIERGLLTAFGNYTGIAVLSAWDKAAFRAYRRELSKGKCSVERELEIFGCEPYQIAACTIQTLGFGADTAFGIALAVGKFAYKDRVLDKSTSLWPAALEWLLALKDGRGYPPRKEDRNFFPVLSQQNKSNLKNSVLETLYVEVAKAKQEAKLITWHLPSASYESTKELLKLA